MNRKRKYEVDAVESLINMYSLGLIEEYCAELQEELQENIDKRGHQLFSQEEIDALVYSVKMCTLEILRQFVKESQTFRLPFPTTFDTQAAFVLARKTILGYDADTDVAHFRNEHDTTGG